MCYVCDICNSLFYNVDSLKQHKLQHSLVKNLFAGTVKFMGTQDLMTETITKRSVILNLLLKPKKVLLTVQVVKVVKENNQLRETFSNLQKGSKGDVTQPDEIFVSESPQGKISKFEKNSNRKQPRRECKNGTEEEGFYKANTSPQGKSVKSNSSGSATLAVLSPKPAVKGKYKCNFCVHFSVHDKLLEHVDLLHSNKVKYACSRCMTSFDDEKSFRIHAKQHKQDDIRDSKQIKAGNKKRKR